MRIKLLPDDNKLIDEIYKSISLNNDLLISLNIRRLLENAILQMYEVIFEKRKDQKFNTMLKKILNEYLEDNFEKEVLNKCDELYKKTSEKIHVLKNTNNEDSIKTILNEYKSYIIYVLQIKNRILQSDNKPINQNELIKEEKLEWKNINSFEVFLFKDLIRKYRISYPIYQRPLIWNMEKMLIFIKFPKIISTIYLSKNPKKNIELHVIDGQQRIKSIFIYIKYCLEKKYITTDDDIDDDIIKNLNSDFSFMKNINNEFLLKFFELLDKEKIDHKMRIYEILDKPFMIQFVKWDEQTLFFFFFEF